MKTLKLCNRNLRSIPKIKNPESVKTLILSRNPIVDFTGLSTLPNLTTLDLRETNLQTLKNAPNLPSLKRILLADTPFSTHPHANTMLSIVFGSELKVVDNKKIKVTADHFDFIKENALSYLLDGWLITSLTPLYLLDPKTRERKSFVPKKTKFALDTESSITKSLPSKKIKAPLSYTVGLVLRDNVLDNKSDNVNKNRKLSRSVVTQSDSALMFTKQTQQYLSSRDVGEIMSMYHEPNYKDLIQKIITPPSTPEDYKESEQPCSFFDRNEISSPKISTGPLNAMEKSRPKKPPCAPPKTHKNTQKDQKVPALPHKRTNEKADKIKVGARRRSSSASFGIDFDYDSDVLLLDDSDGTPRLIPSSPENIRRMSQRRRSIMSNTSELDFEEFDSLIKLCPPIEISIDQA